MTINIDEIVNDLRTLAMVRWRKRRLWQPFMEKYDCQVIAEIGVREGNNFWRMTAHQPRIGVAVDAWVDDGNPAHNDAGYDQAFQNHLYESFKQAAAGKPFAHVYREYSHEAANNFPDEYFDLVYFDADHSYEGLTKDLKAWYPKIKIGGFITGDDYTDHRTPITGVTFGVIRAVNDFAKEHGYEIYEMPARGWAIIK